MISHSQLDVAYAVVPEDRRDVDHEPFPVSHAVCVMRPDHRLARRRHVTVADLDGEDFVSLGSHSVLRMQVNAAMLAAGVSPRVRLETVHSPTVISYVSQGAGIAVIDPFAAMGPGAEQLVIKPFLPNISLTFSAVYRDTHGRSPMALGFTRILGDVLSNYLKTAAVGR